MNDLPVILAYFAQSQDQKHLAMLVEEESIVKRAWETATQDRQNPVRVAFLSRDGRETTVEQIVDDIKKYGERIVMLHFSGHAGHDELLLSDGAGGPDGIAGLLSAYATNLKVVVLNGCSTRGQVETFFRRGVPVVVATQCAVKDSHAKLFATSFHQTLATGQTLQIAYRDAILAVKGRQELTKLLPQTVAETATDVRSGMLDTARTTGTIWGLFMQNAGVSIVNDRQWLAVQYLAGKKPKINPEKAYIFERDKAPYTNIFNAYFDQLNPNRPRVQHYLLAGQQAESPRGLIRKFFFDCVLQPAERQRLQNDGYYYSFSDFRSPNGYVELKGTDISDQYILYSLLASIQGSMPPNSVLNPVTIDDLCRQFFDHNYFKNRQYVLIAFWVPTQALSAVTTRAIIDTILRLDEWAAKKADSTSFLFFWAFEQERSYLDLLSFGQPLKKFFSRFDVLRQGPVPPRICVINQDYKFLKTPQRTDIDDWMNEDFGNTIADDVLQSLYEQKNVETLETKLRKLIDDTNLQIT